MLKVKSGINFLLMLKENSRSPCCEKPGIFTPSMNYLAHAYLSFNIPEVLVGNMISDYVKGKKQFDYPLPVHQGIKLHRAIDQFTDTHAATHELKSFFRPQYRLYSGAFADVVYDHFLANDVYTFAAETDLKKFAANTYQLLDPYADIFPLPFQKMFPYMKAQDWLYNYRYPAGIAKGFEGLVRRSAYLTESEIAFETFNTHYTSMQACYETFFPELKKYSFQAMNELLNS